MPCCDVISTRGFVAGASTGEGTVIAFELDMILSVRPPKRPLAVKLWTRNGCFYWLFQYRGGCRLSNARTALQAIRENSIQNGGSFHARIVAEFPRSWC